ncbi:PDZ and LIM domain protein 2 isoform X2 [Eucyclogobius newberryi]|uniref:PDZ and LIM domain protein 2 isoform X2 n=1 Tax=Eucyclogobius newberryi TaxID=166745 RepID=UPI003B5C25E9
MYLNLIGPAPWGFRIAGGRDFKKAVTVAKVNDGSRAAQGDLQPGDIILEINGENTKDMLNVEVQNKIKSSKTELQLLVERFPALPQTNGINSPDRLTDRFQESVIVSRDENRNYTEHFLPRPASLSPGPYSPGPYSPVPPASPNNNKSVQMRSWSSEDRGLSRPLSQELSPDYRRSSLSSRTPTPPGRYSPHSPTDRDVINQPPRSTSGPDVAMQRFDKDSEVYKMIQENKESRTAPRQSNTFKMLTEVLEADEKEAVLMFPGNLSPNRPKTSLLPGVNKLRNCEKCGTSIVTQAVRITDDVFYHAACYTCTDCGLNLRMRGHFWVEDVMYCEKHANERYHGPRPSP